MTDWRAEFDRLWNDLVPASGQASTVQGELIRCIAKLTDEAYRNGNGNFDDGYRAMCKYLRDRLSDTTVFSAAELRDVDRCIRRILDSDNPDINGSITCYDVIAEKVVRWCLAHATPLPESGNPLLQR